MRMAESQKSGRGRGRYRPPYAGRCSIGTVVAAFRAVEWGSVRGIISGIGLEVGPRGSRWSDFEVDRRHDAEAFPGGFASPPLRRF